MNLIQEAKVNRVKVRPRGSMICSICKYKHSDSGISHSSCGTQSTWLWIRKNVSDDKVCDKCDTISNFTSTECSKCGHSETTETY